MIDLLKKYKKIILYTFFGVCTTIINLIVYFVCTRLFNFSTVPSTIIAWLIAVIFAYITNKFWVFECKSFEKSILQKEIISFFACRIFTGILDIVIMAIFVDILLFNDMIMKFISNVIVIVLNYVASKFWVFKRSK